MTEKKRKKKKKEKKKKKKRRKRSGKRRGRDAGSLIDHLGMPATPSLRRTGPPVAASWSPRVTP